MKECKNCGNKLQEKEYIRYDPSEHRQCCIKYKGCTTCGYPTSKINVIKET